MLCRGVNHRYASCLNYALRVLCAATILTISAALIFLRSCAAPGSALPGKQSTIWRQSSPVARLRSGKQRGSMHFPYRPTQAGGQHAGHGGAARANSEPASLRGSDSVHPYSACLGLVHVLVLINHRTGDFAGIEVIGSIRQSLLDCFDLF